MSEIEFVQLAESFIKDNYCVLQTILNVDDAAIGIICKKESDFKEIFEVLNVHFFKDNYIKEVYKYKYYNDKIISEKLVFDNSKLNTNKKLFNGNTGVIYLN